MNILIKHIKSFIACCGLLLTFIPCNYAQQKEYEDMAGKPMTLDFRFDKAVVDSGYMNNSRMLHHLDSLLTNSQLSTRIDSINIFSFTSPDGNQAYNERLARQRSTAVKGYLVWKYPHLNQYRIHSYPQGENWQELHRLIMCEKNMPNQKEVLQIIDSNKNSEQKKALLMKLNGGIPYQYIHDQMLRHLRNAAICMVWIKADSLPTLPGAIHPNPNQLKKNCKVPQPVVKVEKEAKKKYITAINQPIIKQPLLALKTNLLFDAALMPNIEIEVPIGKHWSVNGEYMFPWWLLDNGKYCLEILSGGLEGRYWLNKPLNRKKQEVLTGHFIGLYAGGGKYDLQWKESGYQGEFFIAAGISYGWATRVARNLHLEFNIGIGLLRTNYRHYHPHNNYQTLQWQENGQYTWFGPTKAKISLVWLLNRPFKKGGTI